MPEEESRQFTDKDVDKAFLLTIEQAVMDLYSEAGALDSSDTPKEAHDKLLAKGGKVHHKVVDLYKSILYLRIGDKLTHVSYVWRENDEFKFVTMTREEYLDGIK